jgi:hypothetical protein
MVTLPFHISHALQPLDVSCSKPFKAISKKENEDVVKNNHSRYSHNKN